MKHTANTWLLAHFIHPFLYSLYMIVREGNVEIGIFPSVLLLGLIFSLPALLFCLLSFQAIKSLHFPVRLSFLLWILAGFAAFIITISFARNYFGWDSRSLPSFVPALFASVISVLLRFPQFQQTFLSEKPAYEKNRI